jgi:drug/metabolite transporter (DMT)-like permease
MQGRKMAVALPGHSATVSWYGFLITLLGAILFSTKAIIVKKAFHSTNLDALTLLTLRMIFSLPFYLAAAFLTSVRRSNTPMKARQWAFVIGLGLFGYYLSSLFDFIGLQYISAGLERLILFLYPTFTVLINAMVFSQRVTANQRLALALTYAGIAIAFLGEWGINTTNRHFFWGSGLIFLCSVTYAIYVSGSGKMIPVLGAAKFTAYSMLAAIAGIFTHYLIRGKGTGLFSPGGAWTYGLILAIVATVIPTFLLAAGMKRIGSSNAVIISSIGPVSTILQAHFFLGEQLLWEQIVGTLLVISGVLLIGLRSRAESTVV